MGAPKRRWTEEEKSALLCGLTRYGPGKWHAIINDTELAPKLSARTNTDLKDKWRNLNFLRACERGKGRDRSSTKSLSKANSRPTSLAAANKQVRNPIPGISNACPFANKNARIAGNSANSNASRHNSAAGVASEPAPFIVIPPNGIPRLQGLILEAVEALEGPTENSIRYYIEENHFVNANIMKIFPFVLESMSADSQILRQGIYYLPFNHSSDKALAELQSFSINEFKEHSESAESLDVDEFKEYSESVKAQNEFKVHLESAEIQDEKEMVEEYSEADFEAEINRLLGMGAEDAAKVAAEAARDAEAALTTEEKALQEVEAAKQELEDAKAALALKSRKKNRRNTSK